ncbi:hypothetical protein BKA82DRAFT_33577 [Pisolithus tinctorius]|nr:hypothetical protein BKA82DRAFT_33577 [Pisolithus tinctorius]
MASGPVSFKLYLRPQDATITSLDAQVVACKENWVITSPNMDFVEEPYIFEEEELCCHADRRLGHSIPTLQIVWYNPTPSDFVVPTGSRFAVGTLQSAKVAAFEEALQSLCSRHHTLRDRPVGQDALRTLMHLARHEVMRLQQHPLLFRDLVMFVAQLQRKILDIYTLLEYIEYVYPLLLNPPSRPPQANSTWMGCFVRATEVCEALYFAGVPVWLVHSKEYIPLTMNIVCSVRLTYPDGIVRSMYMENGVAKPFPSIWRGPSNALHQYHTRHGYEGTLADAPERLPISYPSSSRPSSSSGRQPATRQSRTARDRASAGPSRASSSAGGESKWEEPNLPDILKPHSVFAAAWREADKNLQRVSSGLVDPGYRFPKLTLFVNVSMPERKKIYLFNWLSARALWISQTALRKSAVWDILGEGIINSAQGLAGAPEEITWRGMQVKISSLLNPPLWFIRSLLWELYELNFRYELYALDRALVPNLWTSSDEMRLTRQTLLYSIFPGESGLVMWSESLPQDSCELGLCATDVPTTLLYINKFCHLLSAWPGAPARLQYLVKMKDQDDKEVYAVFSLACGFYVQTVFDFLRQQPSLPRMFQFV